MDADIGRADRASILTTIETALHSSEAPSIGAGALRHDSRSPIRKEPGAVAIDATDHDAALARE